MPSTRAYKTGAIISGATTDGTTIVADSAASTGLRWQGNYSAGKNKIINGDFGIWQRGTSISLSNSNPVYGADRYRYQVNFSAGSASVSQQTFTAGSAPVTGYEGSFYSRLTCGSTTSFFAIEQRIEDVRTFAAQTITVSFWAKASSSITSSFTMVQDFGSGGSSPVNTVGGNIAMTTSWQRFTSTVTLPSISGKTIGTSSFLRWYFEGTTGLNSAVIDLWGVQIEAGSVATAFQTATGTLQGELAACQRYYVFDDSGTRVWTGNCTSGSTYGNEVYLPVTMRVAPTITQTHSTSSGFPGTTPSSARISTKKFYSEKTSDGTTTAGFFQMTWTASAEL